MKKNKSVNSKSQVKVRKMQESKFKVIVNVPDKKVHIKSSNKCRPIKRKVAKVIIKLLWAILGFVVKYLLGRWFKGD